MNNNASHFDQFKADYMALRRKLPRMYGIEAVNLFKKNFDKEGFVYGKRGGIRKWKATKHKTGRKVLTKTRRLRKGIHVKIVAANRVVVSVDKSIAYAEVHNFGGEIPITPKMRRYFWAMFKKTGDNYYKGLALTKKQTFKIPKRMYIGKTDAMKPLLDKRTITELKKLISKYK